MANYGDYEYCKDCETLDCSNCFPDDNCIPYGYADTQNNKKENKEK